MRKLLAISLALLPAFVQSAYADQNLIDIYQIALNRDPALASAISSNLAAQEKQRQGLALLLPTITANSNANHSDAEVGYLGGRSPFSPGQQSFETFSYGVNLNQPVFRMQSFLQYAQSKIQVTQADKQLILSQQDLMTRTAQAYFDVLLSQDKIDLINAQKAAINRQLEQAKANFDAGTATITDVNDAQAKYDLTLAQEIAALNDFEVKKRAMQSITGEVPQKLATVSQDLKITLVEPTDMEKWVEIAEQNNLELIIQQQNLELATKEVSKQQAGHLPTMDLVASYNDTRASGSFNGFGTDIQSSNFGVQVQIPLYQGGATSSKIREAVANKTKAEDDVETARRKADLDTRQAYLNLTGGVAQVKAYEQALSSSQSQLDSTNLAYEVGVRTSVDVLNAQQQYFSAKRDLLQSRYVYLLSIVKLKQAAGVLNELDLNDINSRLVRAAVESSPIN